MTADPIATVCQVTGIEPSLITGRHTAEATVFVRNAIAMALHLGPARMSIEDVAEMMERKPANIKVGINRITRAIKHDHEAKRTAIMVWALIYDDRTRRLRTRKPRSRAVMTQREVAAVMNITHQRVAALEDSAKRKIKKCMESGYFGNKPATT